MYKILLSFFLLILGSFSLFSQGQLKPSEAISAENIQKIKAIEDTISLLSYAVVNDSIEMERFGACRKLIPTLVSALKVENSFKYPFEKVKTISIIAPPDSSFRVFTWQMFVNDSTYKYYGAIQMNSGSLKLFALKDNSEDMMTPDDQILSNDNWYGALYYNIRQFDTKEGRKYLLMGFDAYTFFEKRKLIEVLSFDKKGNPVFGSPVFDMTPVKGRSNFDAPKTRIILEYASEAIVRCNYDVQYDMVLYDHLEPTPNPSGRGDMINVPDGSVEGLKLEKGRWKHVSKVFNDVMTEEQTQIEPVLDKRKGKNMLGKQKKATGY